MLYEHGYISAPQRRMRGVMSNFEQIQLTATPVQVELRWSDQDVNGHVNNARILTVIEEARVRAVHQWTATMPDGTGYRRMVRALNTRFDREVQYGPETTVWVWIPRIGNTSYVVGHLLVQNNQPCVYTEVTIVVVDAATGAPQQHDEDYRHELERHSGPEFSK